MQIQLPEKVSHLEENNNKKWGNEKLLLPTGFEFLYAITALYFRYYYGNLNTVKSRVLMRVTNLKNEFLGVL